MNKIYILEVTKGREIRYFDDITIRYIENATFEQEDNVDEIARFDTREEALAELAKHKNTASFYGNSKLIDSEIFSVIEWEVDEDGELCTGKTIAYAEWDDINLD